MTKITTRFKIRYNRHLKLPLKAWYYGPNIFEEHNGITYMGNKRWIKKSKL